MAELYDYESERIEKQKQLRERSERSFTLGGETFVLRGVLPYPVIKRLSTLGAALNNDDAFAGFEETMTLLLGGGEEMRQKFIQVLNDQDAEFPVTWEEIQELQKWIVEEASGRPPTPPGNSSNSQSANGAASTGTSSTAPAEASTS